MSALMTIIASVLTVSQPEAKRFEMLQPVPPKVFAFSIPKYLHEQRRNTLLDYVTTSPLPQNNNSKCFSCCAILHLPFKHVKYMHKTVPIIPLQV